MIIIWQIKNDRHLLQFDLSVSCKSLNNSQLFRLYHKSLWIAYLLSYLENFLGRPVHYGDIAKLGKCNILILLHQDTTKFGRGWYWEILALQMLANMSQSGRFSSPRMLLKSYVFCTMLQFCYVFYTICVILIFQTLI